MAPHPAGHKLLVAASAILLAACSTTINDPGADVGLGESQPTIDPNNIPEGAQPADQDGSLIDGSIVVDIDTPVTTTPLTGSAADLLPEMSIEMSRLSTQVADGGDADDATLARIEEIWARIRPEIESEYPELLNGLNATLDMARVAVERRRPADADKAFNLLTDLVDQFTGDG